MDPLSTLDDLVVGFAARKDFDDRFILRYWYWMYKFDYWTKKILRIK